MKPQAPVLGVALFAATAVMLAACASTRPAATPGSVHGDPARQIVVTLDNTPTGLRGAGSTRRGTEVHIGSGYSVSAQAAAAAEQLAAEYALRAIDAWPIRMLGEHCVVFEIMDAGVEREALLARLRNDRRVASAQAMRVFETAAAVVADPHRGLQHGMEALQVPQAHAFARGHGVRVAIIDTGADRGHRELAGRIAAHADLVDAQGDGGEAGFDLDRHGTAIAGIVAADAGNGEGIIGVAPEARLVLLKACWPEVPNAQRARCNSFTLALALAAAEEHDAHVINLSLSGPRDALLERMLARLLLQNRVVVGVAADGSGFPGAVEGVIAVSDEADAGVHAAALIAPGRDVLTLAPHNRYEFQSGSSLAVAHVSGIVALLRERDPGLGAARVRMLLATGNGKGREVNACTALRGLVPDAACPRQAVPASLGEAGTGLQHHRN